MRPARNLSLLGLAAVSAVYAEDSFASGLNHYQTFLEKLGMHDHHALHNWQVVPASLLVTGILLVFSFLYKTTVNGQLAAQDYEPRSRFNPANIIELVMDFVYDLAKSVLPETFRRHLLLLTSLFFFIFFNNLSGLIPGFPPATESMSTNLALALIVVFVYHFSGVKEHGGHYAKQFTGPIIWLAVMMIPIELISHSARPLSLSLRLYINVYADHLILGLFGAFPIAQFFLPGLFMLFGLLVCCIQSFIFVLLTGIYIAMAESHDH